MSRLRESARKASLTRVLLHSDPSNKVNTVCRLVREDLEQRDVFHFANTILTSHVRQRPPAYEDALNLLVQLKGTCAASFDCPQR